MNQVVYYNLAVATVAVTSHHSVQQHYYNRDVYEYSAFNNFCERYNEDAVKNESEYSLRSKILSYHLTLSPNTAQYIDNFLT